MYNFSGFVALAYVVMPICVLIEYLYIGYNNLIDFWTSGRIYTRVQKIYAAMVEFAEYVEIALSIVWLNVREICGIVLMTIQQYTGYPDNGNKNKQKSE